MTDALAILGLEAVPARGDFMRAHFLTTLAHLDAVRSEALEQAAATLPPLQEYTWLARDILALSAPHLEVEGELQGDAALSEEVRRHFLPGTKLVGSANLLIMPSLDAANIAFNLLKITGGYGVTVGPMLLGAAKPVHILNPAATSRRIVNMTAVAVADAGATHRMILPSS